MEISITKDTNIEKLIEDVIFSSSQKLDSGLRNIIEKNHEDGKGDLIIDVNIDIHFKNA